MLISAQSGYGLEAEFFGLPPTFFRLIPAKEEYPACLETVKQNQEKYGWDSLHPSTPPANVLYDAVRELLTEAGYPDTELFPLHFYCAINTSLDEHYGMDGVFVFEGCFWGIDLTLNPRKTRARPHCTLITKVDIEEDRLPALGKTVARKLLTELRKHSPRPVGLQRQKKRRKSSFSKASSPVQENEGRVIDFEIERDLGGKIITVRWPLGVSVSLGTQTTLRHKFFHGESQWDIQVTGTPDGMIMTRK